MATLFLLSRSFWCKTKKRLKQKRRIVVVRPGRPKHSPTDTSCTSPPETCFTQAKTINPPGPCGLSRIGSLSSLSVFCPQTTLCLGLLFYTPGQDENTYGKSKKHGSPTDDVVKPPIQNMYYFYYYFNMVLIFSIVL